METDIDTTAKRKRHPNEDRKNYFCSHCRARFKSRPAVRDHIDDAHPNRIVFVLKKIETVRPITTIDGESYGDV